MRNALCCMGIGLLCALVGCDVADTGGQPAIDVSKWSIALSSHGPDTTAVVLRYGDVVRDQMLQRHEIESRLSCSTRPELHCVVTSVVGVHGSRARVYHVEGGQLAASSYVVTSSVGIQARDLDGDGDLDLAVPANDYEPNFAQGGNFWMTYELQGWAYRMTGCSDPIHGRLPRAPAALLSGGCAG